MNHPLVWYTLDIGRLGGVSSGLKGFGACLDEILCFWNQTFAPQLDPSVAIVTECRYFPEILWHSYLPVYMWSLEIAWWCRDWTGIMRSWLTRNVRTKWTGNDAASQLTCGSAPVRLIRTNSRPWPCSSLSVLYIFWLLMSIIGLM